MTPFIIVLKQKIWRWQRIIRSRLGIGSKMHSPDREFQEQILVPTALILSNPRKALYIGVSWYTYHYYTKFFSNIDLVTLDISKAQAVYGLRKKHIIGGLDSSALIAHIPFDVIFLLGVLNYGINTVNDFRAALKNINECLSDDGCCYLTIEENNGGTVKNNLSFQDTINIAKSMNFWILPISDWFTIVGGHTQAMFLVMGKSRQTIEYISEQFLKKTKYNVSPRS